MLDSGTTAVLRIQKTDGTMTPTWLCSVPPYPVHWVTLCVSDGKKGQWGKAVLVSCCVPHPRSMVEPSAEGRKRLECKVALKESRSDTSIPVLIHGMWKGKGNGVHVATIKKLDFFSCCSLININHTCDHFTSAQGKQDLVKQVSSDLKRTCNPSNYLGVETL
jgi:hypothetical protein